MTKKLWGGRFKKKTDPDAEEFTSSIHIDNKLAEYDVIGSLIHVKVLEKAGIIFPKEKKLLEKGLLGILNNIKSAKFEFDKESEDIHTDIQNKLEKKIGKTAFKLHTLRSRNDQIVFDTKLYCASSIKELVDLIADLSKSLSGFAKRNKNIVLPGYTHLQHAQKILLGDYISAYLCMLNRDTERLNDIQKRLKVSLGSGALAGTILKRKWYNEAAKKWIKDFGIEFNLAENSIDNVSNRDFIVELLGALAISGMHLSRLAEDFIIWSTREFGFIEIDDAFCTGSSLMPQKKNPDVLELMRGYTGKLYGNLVSVLVTMKGLPLTYNRDMQLDKEPLFNSIKIIEDELKILAKLINKTKINKENIARQLQDESLYATDLAFCLVKKGVAFKQAHNIAGRLIRYSIGNKVKISQMPDGLLKQFSPKLNTKDVKKIFTQN